MQARFQLHARIFKILAAKFVGHFIARKKRMKYNPTTSKVCFNVAHAFAPTIGIALCNLVVTTTMHDVRPCTNHQKNGTVQPAGTSQRSNAKLGARTDRERNMAGQLGANMGSSKDDQIQP